MFKFVGKANIMENKNIKVFISSTFRDLNIERDYLVQTVFPDIRKNLQNTDISEVDLRWGITDEESRNKRVLDLCMRYLYESKPFFIGILGERYGSVLKKETIELSPLVEEAYPQIWEDIDGGASITEIEIMNGVLRAPVNERPNAIFFILETDRPYSEENNGDFNKLQALKEKIRQQEIHPWYTYSKLEDLDKVKDFILKHIEEKQDEQHSSNFQSGSESIQIAENMLKQHCRVLENTRKLIPHSYNVLNALLPVIERAKPIAILEGMEGNGKSSLVAQLGGEYANGTRKYIHIYGNVPEIPCTNSLFIDFFMLGAKRVLEQEQQAQAEQSGLKGWLKRNLGKIDYNVTEELIRGIKQNKWCFVLDNVNSLRTRIINPMLYIVKNISNGIAYLNERFGIKIDYRILVVQNHNSPYSLKGDWEKISMPLNSTINPAQFVTSYLAKYSKNLDTNKMGRFLNCSCMSHPRSMFLVCEYIRESVKHEQLDAFINRIASFKQTTDTYNLFLEQLDSFMQKGQIRRLAGLVSLFSYGIHLKDLEHLSGLDNLTFHRAWNSLKKLTVEEPTGAVHWANEAIADFVDKTLVLYEADFRSSLAQECQNYFFHILDNLFTPEKLFIQINKGWWLWKSDLISSIHDPDKSRIELLRMNDMEIISYLSGKGCLTFEHIKKHVYPNVFTRNVMQESMAAVQKARKANNGKTLMDMLKDNTVSNYYTEGFFEKIDKFRMPKQHEIFCYLESCIAQRKWEHLENELANPESLNYVWNTSVLLDCWMTGMERGKISIIQKDMRQYNKMLQLSYALRDEEGIKYYSTQQ